MILEAKLVLFLSFTLAKSSSQEVKAKNIAKPEKVTIFLNNILENFFCIFIDLTIKFMNKYIVRFIRKLFSGTIYQQN